MSSAAETYERDLLDALSEGLRRRLQGAGSDVRALGDPGEVAERMLSVVPVQHPWDTQIGPFYDTPAVVRLLGVSKQAVADRARRGTLLRVTTRQGRHLYPVFQFDGRHLVLAVPEVLGPFRDTHVDGWAVASWFTTPAAVLDGATPAQWLRDGHDPAPVVAIAHDVAARWSR